MRVELSDEALDFVSYLVLPVFEILLRKRRR